MPPCPGVWLFPRARTAFAPRITLRLILCFRRSRPDGQPRAVRRAHRVRPEIDISPRGCSSTRLRWRGSAARRYPVLPGCDISAETKDGMRQHFTERPAAMPNRGFERVRFRRREHLYRVPPAHWAERAPKAAKAPRKSSRQADRRWIDERQRGGKGFAFWVGRWGAVSS